jgi:hypothetical protein
MSTHNAPTDIAASPIARFVTTDTFTSKASSQLPFPSCHGGCEYAEPGHSLMFRARRDLSRGGVFHFVTSATTEKRGRGYECAGRPVAARRPLVHARAGAIVCKRTHVLPLGSIAAPVS